MKKLLIASCIGLISLPLFAQNVTNNSQELSIAQKFLSYSSCIPALDVKIIPLINKELSIPLKDQELSYTYKVETAETNLPWLNQLLLNSLISGLDTNDKNINSKQELIKYYKKVQQADLNELIELFSDSDMIAGGQEFSSSLIFLGQRLNIASFQRNTYIYHNGAAHGIGFVKTLNFDLHKKILLSSQDIIIPGKKQDLLNLLWENYNLAVMENDPFIEKNQLYISPDFLFDMNGITFIYQPYDIGPYSMGNIELKLPWYQLKDLIKPEYQW